MQNHPVKLNEEESNYLDSEGEEKCGNCFHFYTRDVDKYRVCELVRLKDEASIDPSYVCDFWADGKEEAES
jgi:hypothetical protein